MENDYYHIMQTGWRCPQCGIIYRPDIMNCYSCSIHFTPIWPSQPGLPVLPLQPYTICQTKTNSGSWVNQGPDLQQT